MELPAWFVVLMGMGTVFIGLFLIVLLCKLLSFAFAPKKAKKEDQPAKSAEEPQKDCDRNAVLAAAAAAIAADCGTDADGIRILKFERVNKNGGTK